MTLYQTFDKQMEEIQGDEEKARSTGFSWKSAFDKTKSTRGMRDSFSKRASVAGKCDHAG